jgi:hypothetical protein
LSTDGRSFAVGVLPGREFGFGYPLYIKDAVGFSLIT